LVIVQIMMMFQKHKFQRFESSIMQQAFVVCLIRNSMLKD